jgi:anti-anti-sigma factor
MQLTLEHHDTGDVIVIRCRGRIVTGDEARLLQEEVEKRTALTKNVLLQLADVSYIDSGGLGSLVRLLGVLRSARGDLKLCQPPPFVVQVLRATNLLTVFHPYTSEAEAVEAFFAKKEVQREHAQTSDARIVCVDNSMDLLAYLRVLLQRSGYEVFTTQYAADAAMFAKGATKSIVICGPGIQTNAIALAKLQGLPKAKLLHLPADFSTSQADQAAPQLLNQVRSLLASS